MSSKACRWDFQRSIFRPVSYPEISDLGRQDHVRWGALLLVTHLHGPGKLSLDHWLKSRLGAKV